MKKTFTSLIVALALLLCAFVFAAEAAPVSKNSADQPMKILIVGSSSIGSAAAVAAVAARADFQIVYSADGDGLTALKPDLPAIINSDRVIPITTVPEIKHDVSRKMETPRSVSNFTRQAVYDLPEKRGFRGESSSNLIRPSPYKIS